MTVWINSNNTVSGKIEKKDTTRFTQGYLYLQKDSYGVSSSYNLASTPYNGNYSYTLVSTSTLDNMNATWSNDEMSLYGRAEPSTGGYTWVGPIKVRRTRVNPTPQPPSGVSATNTYTDRITVTWNASSGASYYQVYRGTSSSSYYASALSTWQNSTSYNDYSATAGTTYYYWVKAATSSSGANASNLSSSYDSGYRANNPTPQPPSGVSATDTYTDRITVTWNASSGASYYQVYRGTSSSSYYASALSTWQNSTSYNDYSATAGTTYYYWVKAATSSSGANASNLSSSYDSGYRANNPTPQPPSGVSATNTYTDRITVTWNASSGASYYQVYRGTSSSSYYASALSTWQNSTSYNDYSATAGTTYYYWVKAATSSSGANASNLSSSYDSGYRANNPTPQPPSGVSATNTYTDRITVTWNASSGASYYQVYRGTSSSSYYASALSTWQNSTSYNDYSATAGTTYYYWVKAATSSSGANASNLSSSYDSGYRANNPTPQPPSGVSATKTYTDRIAVSWYASSGASYYQVYRGTSSSSYYASALSTWQNSTSYNDYSATAGTTYYYWVKAATSSSGANASNLSSSYDSGYRANNPTPQPPSGVSATNTYTDRITVTWNASSGASYYQVYRGTSSSSYYASALSTWQNSTSYNDYSATARDNLLLLG